MLTSLAVVDVNKATIGAYPYAIGALKEATTALYAIFSFPDNRRRAMQCGQGKEEMERFNGCVRILVRVLRNGSSRGIRYALLTLNPLCLYSEEIYGEARKEGVLEICMGLLDDENEKIRISTSNLIEVLIGNHLMR
ncbi:hypothetical protein UlMin_016297 [Ulmus minor]